MDHVEISATVDQKADVRVQAHDEDAGLPGADFGRKGIVGQSRAALAGLRIQKAAHDVFGSLLGQPDPFDPESGIPQNGGHEVAAGDLRRRAWWRCR
ncbi:MAG: hypothetical protein QM755_14610 [Luteolibacter sp.]